MQPTIYPLVKNINLLIAYSSALCGLTIKMQQVCISLISQTPYSNA